MKRNNQQNDYLVTEIYKIFPFVIEKSIIYLKVLEIIT